MKLLSTSVAIACDSAPGNFQRASAIRSVLETFGLQVYFYHLLQQQNVLDFLAGDRPDCDYTIWFCYGRSDENGNELVNFSVVHQQDNDYKNKSGWERVNVTLTPANVSQYIQNAQGILICSSMIGSYWSEAMLNQGYQAFIAPQEPDLANNSYMLFLTGFFYYLMMHSLDYTEQQFSPEEATFKAAVMDKDYQFGTQLFYYYV
ncbi:MAG: hypothetical protein Tsb0014_47120 [Pleurocapsa sp.]